jgi:hypothetical protein
MFYSDGHISHKRKLKKKKKIKREEREENTNNFDLFFGPKSKLVSQLEASFDTFHQIGSPKCLNLP